MCEAQGFWQEPSLQTAELSLRYLSVLGGPTYPLNRVVSQTYQPLIPCRARRQRDGRDRAIRIVLLSVRRKVAFPTRPDGRHLPCNLTSVASRKWPRRISPAYGHLAAPPYIHKPVLETAPLCAPRCDLLPGIAMRLYGPLTFEERSFRETPLGEEANGSMSSAIMSLLDRRAFFMTGAGSSAGAPTGLPTGPQLSARLAQWARDIGCGDALDGADESDLGEVCAALEGAIERGQLVRHIGQDVDWADSEFNLCHLAIALFFAEQLMRVGFTVNWDPKIDDAIAVVANGKRPKIAHDPQTMSSVGSDPFLLHMHGRWSDPDSLVMTNAELDKPGAIKWTDPNLRATLSSNDPIFVGFAAEARLRDPFTERDARRDAGGTCLSDRPSEGGGFLRRLNGASGGPWSHRWQWPLHTGQRLRGNGRTVALLLPQAVAGGV